MSLCYRMFQCIEYKRQRENDAASEGVTAEDPEVRQDGQIIDDYRLY